MFFDFSKEKIARILVVTFLIALFMVVALQVNGKYKIGESYDLYARKASAQASYIWSHKIFDYLRHPADSLSMLAGLGAWKGSVSADVREARSVPVLVYHGIPDEGSGDNPFSSVNFADQMAALKNAGWNTVSLEEFRSFMRGDIDLPERSFLLTFDDGRKDTFYPSDPVLRDLGFKAVMFAITKKSVASEEDSSYYMSEFELQNMENGGRWEVESHGRDSHDWYNLDNKGTIGHFFSNRLWLPDQNRIETPEEYRDRVAYDLRTSKSDLENTLGKQVDAFAFPFSDFGQDTVNYPESQSILAEEVSKMYSLAFYQVWNGMGETFNYPNPSLRMIKRIEPTEKWSGQFLLDALESGISKDLPYASQSFGSEWRGSWGEVDKGDSLALKATKETTGASSALNGSYWWQDYTFEADVDWQSGSNVVMVARKADDKNYYGCNFSQNKISIKRTVEGSSQNLLSEKYILPTEKPLSLGIRVKGSEISCMVNGVVALHGTSINSRIGKGGIGLEIWDESPGKADVRFDNISVKPE